MITVKKSITQAVVSVFAAAVMVITSTASVFADNVYTSESGNQWGTPGSQDGCVHTVEDGVLTSTRTKFRNSKLFYSANADGTEWVDDETQTSYKVVESAWLAENQTIATGKAQAKFDFKFDGGVGQKFMFRWRSYDTNLGVRFQKSGAQRIRLNGVPDQNISVALNDEVWYTAIIVLDLATAEQTVTIKNGSETVAEGVLPLRSGETAPTGKAVTGLCFKSPADGDYTNRTSTDVTEVDYPSSVWHIRNVSYDAYTETNYALENVYRSADGVTTNKAGEGFTLQGLALTRFTNFAVPANTSLVTASYDANNRMVGAEVKNLSQVGTTPVEVGVAGDTVKSFILDMDTATPFVSAYDHATVPTTTVRKWDFEEGFTETDDSGGATVTKMAEGSNNILKFERNIFGNDPYWKWNGTAWEESTEDTASNFKQPLLFGETAKSLTLSFKVKFEGNVNPSGNQAVDITFGTADKPFFLKRGFDGKVTVNNNYGGPWSSIGTIDAGVWYDVTLDATFGNTTDGSTFVWTIAKDGATVCTSTTTIKSHDFSAGVDRVNIGSRRDQDTIGTSATADAATYKQTSSVWYIDDVEIKY